nr:hypothetical protein [Tanacetum cinerariifolium]
MVVVMRRLWCSLEVVPAVGWQRWLPGSSGCLVAAGGVMSGSGGNNSLGTKKCWGSNSGDGGNTGDGVKIVGRVIGSYGGIGGNNSLGTKKCWGSNSGDGDGEAMINYIHNGDQPLPVIAQVSLAGNAQNAPPTLKDPKFWTAEEKKTRKIDCLVRFLFIQGLLNDIYSIIDSNETAKDLWDAIERHMRGSEYGEQDRKAAILSVVTRKTTQNQGDLNYALGYKKKAVVVTSDTLALVAEKMKVSKRKEKVVVSSNSEGSGADDFSELKKITTLLAKAFNRRKFYPKPTNNNLRTSSEFVKSDDKKVEKKDDEKKRDMSKVKCYNCKKEGHFAKDCKKAKVKDYNYYKTKILLAKKDSDEQVLLAEDQAWIRIRKSMQTWSSWLNGCSQLVHIKYIKTTYNI